MSDNQKQDEIIIRTHDVTKVYVLGNIEKVYALRGISVDVRRGEYLSILGPSGSGKSTFFNMVGALDRPTEGYVMVDGYNLQNLNQKQLAWIRCHKMGYIFQQFNLIQTMTALENVALPRIFAGEKPEDAREQAAEILKVVGLGHRMTHLPGQVSGGQQQRIAIARALVNKPSIILADEPTGNLDEETARGIMNLLFDINRRGTAIIMVTHNQSLIRMFPARVITLENGVCREVASQA